MLEEIHYYFNKAADVLNIKSDKYMAVILQAIAHASQTQSG